MCNATSRRAGELEIYLTLGLVSVVKGNDTVFQQRVPLATTPDKLITLDSKNREPLYEGLVGNLYVTVLNAAPGVNADFSIEFQSPSMGGIFGIGPTRSIGL